jgi:DNA (cytosine-5)-methyltransferase 1
VRKGCGGWGWVWEGRGAACARSCRNGVSLSARGIAYARAERARGADGKRDSAIAVTSREVTAFDKSRLLCYSPRMELILSLFPGIDLLGRGFEAEGFSVVRGPDILWGGDIRSFDVPAGRFDGVIGGSPCQDFSGANRNPSGYSLEMLKEFERVVLAARPAWFLLENVPRVPDVCIPGYVVQRLDLNARECGMRQIRLRHFQFGSLDGSVISPVRVAPVGKHERIALATEGSKPERRGWSDFCELQGLPRNFDLSLSVVEKYKAVGNGVPLPMARVIARAVKNRLLSQSVRLCVCGCGRLVEGRQLMALAACRKRMERRRSVTELSA